MKRFQPFSRFLSIIVVLILIGTPLFSQDNATITGVVKDKKTGNPLIGANVVVKDEKIGAASNFDGKFTILNVPKGKHILKVSYIGYQKKEIEINVTNDRVNKKILLHPRSVKGKVVEISAQAKGQISAINQQISSSNINNVVAAEKIQALPQANAAEAVGRLPGISLKREGGEGNKVVIRGLSPKYSNIKIDGVNLSSTDKKNRSADLSMISQYMLEGIEVTKTAMADQKGDQIGGTVNFRMREAGEKPMLKIITQGGYKSMREELTDRKFVAMASKRFFDDKLGVLGNIDIGKRNRSSNNVRAGYSWLNVQKMPTVDYYSMGDVTRDVNRYGGNIIIDYTTQNTKIKLGNVYTEKDETKTLRSSSINVSGNVGHNLNYKETEISNISNYLKFSQRIQNTKISGKISRSYTKNKVPEEFSYGGTSLYNVIDQDLPDDINPDDIVNYKADSTGLSKVTTMTFKKPVTEETNWSANLDFKTRFDFTDNLNIVSKAGVMYEYKDRKYDTEVIVAPVTWGNSAYQELLTNNYPGAEKYINKHPDEFSNGTLPYKPTFMDEDFDPGNFMSGEYEITNVPDLEMGREFYQLVKDSLGVNWEGGEQAVDQLVPNFVASNINDYSGNEYYYAGYFMPKINYGANRQVTFIPGIRYEYKKTEYTATRGREVGNNRVGYDYHKAEEIRDNLFLLPMMNLIIRPTEHINIKGAYSKTLARPSYWKFIPSWNIPQVGNKFSYRNYKLKPEKSTNWDLRFTVHGNKLGLISIGGYKKTLKDKIFSREVWLFDTTEVLNYGLTKEETGRDPSFYVQHGMNTYVNNSIESNVWGIETEWQTNLWFLPGLLQNIVINGNYTHIFSEATYPKVEPKKEWKDTPFGQQEVIVSTDTMTVEAPLLNQPDDILNFTVGYDYKGFSFRASMQYKADVFVKYNWYESLRSYKAGFTLYDLSLKQELPVEGMELFCNMSNLSKAIEKNHIKESEDLYTNKSYYGLTLDLGISYEF